MVKRNRDQLKECRERHARKRKRMEWYQITKSGEKKKKRTKEEERNEVVATAAVWRHQRNVDGLYVEPSESRGGRRFSRPIHKKEGEYRVVFFKQGYGEENDTNSRASSVFRWSEDLDKAWCSRKSTIQLRVETRWNMIRKCCQRPFRLNDRGNDP